MKRKRLLLTITTAAALIGVTIGLAVNHNLIFTKVEATQHTTNYDSYTYSGSYYDGFDFYVTGGMNGALRKALTNKCKPNDYYIYSGNGAGHLSEVLQVADQDPTNSSNMIFFYTRDSVAKTPGTITVDGKNVIQWNREHVWCQSLSRGNWGEDEGGTDILHLRPTYGATNESRGNTPYGDINKSSPKYFDPDTKKVTADSSKMLFGYSNGTYFEPLDSVKGDVARIIMYTWTIYNEHQKENGTYYNPLYINDVFQSYDTLLRWHTLDQPDVLEGNRNNYAESSDQGNRNPFVDHPELGWRIFGNAASQQVLNECKATYPFEGGLDPVSPTSVTLNKTTANVVVNSNLQLTASLVPANADAIVTWSTSDENIATVSPAGLVTANNLGEVTITARVSNTIYAECAITVINDSGTDYTKVASYNFNPGTATNAESDNSGVLTLFNNAAVSGTGLSNIVTSVSGASKVYSGYTGYTNLGLKFGTSSANGTFTLALNKEINRVVVKAAGWGASDTLKVGSANAQTPGIAYDQNNPIKTLTYDISPSNSVAFTFTKRGFIQSIDFYLDLSGPKSHLVNASSLKTIAGNESINHNGSKIDSITFSSAGIGNGVAIGDINIGLVALSTAKGTNSGGNVPKYYTSGSSMRVYGGNTLTFTYSRPITQITLTSSGSMSALAASTGTLSNGVWTGSATSVVISNTNTSDHIKISSISVTYEADVVETSDVVLRFGAKISIDDWTAINDEWPISDYGVMLVKESTLTNTYHETSVENAFKNSKTVKNINRGSSAHPLASGDDYIFTVRLSILDSSDYATVYCAAPYIVADGEYYFLEEMRYSVRTLASECYNNGQSPLSHDALGVLKDN